MTFETLQVSADDDTRLAVYRWRSTTTARAILIIVHGMAEHARRYDRFAGALAEAGIDVHGFDLRGHGATTPVAEHGFLGAKAGWKTLLDDVARVRTRALDVVGRRPVFVLGHSLGSFIVQGVLQRRGPFYAGAILSATAMPGRLGCRLGAALATLEASRVDATGTSALLQRLTIGGYAQRLGRRTGRPMAAFDWLSSDAEAVAEYAADPDCGFALRARTWRQVLSGIARIRTPHARRRMPTALPVLIVAGREDPMGNFGRGPCALTRALDNDGQSDLTLHLYAGARHELLHESIADTVTADIRAWIETRLRHTRVHDVMTAID